MTTPNDTVQHRWFEEVWNKGRADAIDELGAPDVLGHGLVDADGNEVRGVEAFKSFYEKFRSAFPDIQITVEDTVSEGDKVLARCHVKATHTGEGLGFPPTNKPVDFTGMCLIRIENGKIAESWNSFDFLTMFQQLGVINFPNA